MAKKNTIDTKDDLKFLDIYDDQYEAILDNIDTDESTDSETTDVAHFRVLNSKNAYPKNNNVDKLK
ncbi:MAG: hypothetical protein ACRDA3_00290 [Peptostreptococcaceae bacterium]